MKPWLSYYDGAYGPTIRIATFNREQLEVAHRLFQELASGKCAEVGLYGALGCARDGIRDFYLGAASNGHRESIRRVTGDAPPAFRWINDREGWLECAEKLEPLLAKDDAGHQYLSGPVGLEVLVEFAYKEGPAFPILEESNPSRGR